MLSRQKVWPLMLLCLNLHPLLRRCQGATCCEKAQEGVHRGKLYGLVPTSEPGKFTIEQGTSMKSCSPCRVYIALPLSWQLTYMPSGVSCHFILIITGIPEPTG